MRSDQVIEYRLLLEYRVMAYVTATLLVILVFAGVPLQVAFGHPGVANDVGTVHGFLYLVYLYVAFRLTRKLRLPLVPMLLVLLAGTVPFCMLVAERYLTRLYHQAVGAPVPRADAPARNLEGWR
jgi:integral membrane protein